MNKIYKVKKNAAGHSVACSEFAKGHVRQAVLGSLLIAGALGISNTASAQSVHYSDYSGSYDLDCYRTGRNVHNSRYPDPRKLFWDRRPTNNETKAECVVISGGKNNTIGKAIASTIGGGYGNEIKHPDDDNINAVTISGGKFNKAMQTDATVSGGSKNQAMSGGSTVGGGHKISPKVRRRPSVVVVITKLQAKAQLSQVVSETTPQVTDLPLVVVVITVR